MKSTDATLNTLLQSALGPGVITTTGGSNAVFTIPSSNYQSNYFDGANSGGTGLGNIGYMQQLTDEWTQRPSKVEQAFKVMSKLKELSLINIHSIEDFIKTVIEISKVL